MATVTVTDDKDPNPRVELVSIDSNEPDNAIGDGNTADDVQGAEPGTDDRAGAAQPGPELAEIGSSIAL